MSCYTNAKDIEMKIGKILAKEGLVYTFHTHTYPITLVISQNQSPCAQMSFMETGDDGVSSKDASLRFIFELDGLKIHTSSRLIITDELMSKLKGLAKKLHAAYVHAFFADKIDIFNQPTESYKDDAPDGEDVPENAADDPFADFMGQADNEAPEDTEGEE